MLWAVPNISSLPTRLGGRSSTTAAVFPLAVGVAANVALVFYRATVNEGSEKESSLSKFPPL